MKSFKLKNNLKRPNFRSKTSKNLPLLQEPFLPSNFPQASSPFRVYRRLKSRLFRVCPEAFQCVFSRVFSPFAASSFAPSLDVYVCSRRPPPIVGCRKRMNRRCFCQVFCCDCLDPFFVCCPLRAWRFCAMPPFHERFGATRDASAVCPTIRVIFGQLVPCICSSAVFGARDELLTRV